MKVNDGLAAGAYFVLDAVAGRRVVLHNLVGPAVAVEVQLEEDDVFLGGHAQLVVFDETLNDSRIQDGQEKVHQVGIPGGCRPPKPQGENLYYKTMKKSL